VKIRSLIHKHPVWSFFLLTYLISWSAWLGGRLLNLNILTFFFSYGPALAAILLSAALEGPSGLLELLRRVFRWRVGLRWYLAAFFIPLGGVLLAVYLSAATGLLQKGLPNWGAIAGPLSLAIFGLAPLGFVVLLGEEIGWRGYAQPKMLERYNPFITSLLVGLGWGVWHWVYLWESSNWRGMIYFVLETMAISLAYTWLFDRTGGSLVVVTLLHTFYDACGYSFLSAAPLPTDTLVVLGVHLLVGAAAVALGGTRWFFAKGRQNEVCSEGVLNDSKDQGADF
jgi:membrane protease YdiL (CAAX protease family)